MKVLAGISAVALVLATSVTAESAPMRNLNKGLCIQTTGYDSASDEYSIKLGSCSDEKRVIDFSFNGKAIATDDDYCLAVSDSNVVLETCLPSNEQKWTKVGVKQIRSAAAGKCIAAKGAKVVLSACDVLPSDDKTDVQQWEIKTVSTSTSPAPTSTPAPALLSCSSVNFVCGKDATLVNNYCGNPQHPKCSFERCCKTIVKPLMTCAKSGLVCQKYDAKPINRLVYCGNSGHPACTIDRCCIRNPRTCAKAGIRCPAGSYFINNYCKGPANPQHPKCDQKRCCRQMNPIKTSCAGWNNCPNGETLNSGAYYTYCTIGKPFGGLKECTASYCCSPIPIQNNKPYY